MMDDGYDGATEWETAGWIVEQHETGRCPQCSAGGCWLNDWATGVRSGDGEVLTAGSTVRA
jgi:hypothetical protein